MVVDAGIIGAVVIDWAMSVACRHAGFQGLAADDAGYSKSVLHVAGPTYLGIKITRRRMKGAGIQGALSTLSNNFRKQRILHHITSHHAKTKILYT